MKHVKIWHSCDGCGWMDTHHLTNAETEKEAKRQAKEHDWIFKRNGVYCPECAKRLNKIKS